MSIIGDLPMQLATTQVMFNWGICIFFIAAKLHDDLRLLTQLPDGIQCCCHRQSFPCTYLACLSSHSTTPTPTPTSSRRFLPTRQTRAIEVIPVAS